MRQHTLFEYIWMKIIVTILRSLLAFQSFFPTQRDNALAKDIRRERIKIPSRERGRHILADLYYPSGYSSSSSSGPKPVLVNWHGSGFVLPFLGSDSVFCAQAARSAGLIVVDADYRKAPENPFPAAVEDIEDTLRWVGTQPSRFDVKRVGVSGFSAGGNLALVAASALRKTIAEINIAAVVAVYPPVNLSIAPEAKTAPKPRKPIPAPAARLFNNCYVPDKPTRSDPRVSPGLADPADFPSTVAILTCDGDVLAPEANTLAENLKDGKREIVNVMLNDVHHAFDKGATLGSNEWVQRDKAYDIAVKTLRDALTV